MSFARKHPWWVTSLGKARALRVAIAWTGVTVLNWFLLSESNLWFLRLLVFVTSAAVAVDYWATWLYYVRHPEFEQFPPRSGGNDQ